MAGNVRLLPVLIFVAVLSFSFRLVQVYTGLSRYAGSAFAESPQENNIEPAAGGNNAPPQGGQMPSPPVADPARAGSTGHDAGEAKAQETGGKDATPVTEWKDASDSDLDTAGVKMDILEEINDRRKKLDEREKNLQVREAMLKAASQELDRKYQELEKLRKEIEGLLDKQKGEEDGRIESLVKIYEGMKPADAARIFDTLDLDVLVSVMGKMSERKISPILAAMSAERARTITIMLAEQKKLPQLPH